MLAFMILKNRVVPELSLARLYTRYTLFSYEIISRTELFQYLHIADFDVEAIDKPVLLRNH